jgi:hypothetical protein
MQSLITRGIHIDLKLAPHSNFMFPDRFVDLRVFLPLKCYLPTRTALLIYNTRRSSALCATQLPLDLHTLAIQTVGIIFMTGC